MKAIRITEITLETAETLTIRWRADSDAGQADGIHCARCGSATAILGRGGAGPAIRSALRQLCGDAALEGLHLARTDGGNYVVCLDSLRHAVPQPLTVRKFPIHQDLIQQDVIHQDPIQQNPLQQDKENSQ